MSNQYDLVVIGGGPAGGSAADAARRAGARVALIERHLMGGTCLNFGCDPTKGLLYRAETLQRARRLGRLQADWPAAVRHIRAAINQMRGGDDAQARQALRARGIDVFDGQAAFRDPHTLHVAGEALHAEQVVLATGTRPAIPEIDGLAEAGYLTNEQAPYLPKLPRRLVILGGGPLAVEFAQIFCRFGVRVTIFEQEARILTREEPELAERLAAQLCTEGVRIETGAEVVRIAVRGEARQLHFRTGGRAKIHTWSADAILIAAGRIPNTDALGLEYAGVALDKHGAVEVDRFLRTNIEHIWGAGDVNNGYPFTHVASVQGALAAHNALGKRSKAFDTSAVPWATYTSPALAHVGQTEEQLREEGRAYSVAWATFDTIARAILEESTVGAIKLLISADQRLLGAHILAPSAELLLVPFVLAMQAELPVAQLRDLLIPYPSLAEIITESLRE